MLTTTAADSRLNNNVPMTDAHLSVAFEDILLPRSTTVSDFISSGLTITVMAPIVMSLSEP